MAADRTSSFLPRLSGLTDNQLAWLRTFHDGFLRDGQYARHPQSDLVSDRFLHLFGDVLRIQHCLSVQALSKDKFEYAMESACRGCGFEAVRAVNCLPGQDITVNGVNWSLKTQADQSLKEDRLHISKFMELGKGKWQTEDDLKLLLGRYLAHLSRYERIFSLRYFRPMLKKAKRGSGKTSEVPLSAPDAATPQHRYELVEIPKNLLVTGAGFPIRMMAKTKQTDHPPAYCDVKDKKGELLYQLYFDGGSERKLQIKHFRKELCFVHATWRIQLRLS